MVTCPSCKQHAMSGWRKMNIGPLSDIACASCGKRLRGSWWMVVVVMLGALMGGRLSGEVDSPEVGLIPIAASALVALLVVRYLVPVAERHAPNTPGDLQGKLGK